MILTKEILLNLTGMCFSHFPLKLNKSKLPVIFNPTTNTQSTWILRSFQGLMRLGFQELWLFKITKAQLRK